MATSFKGWLNTWGGSWGPISSNPGDAAGAAGFAITAIATASGTATAFGSASLTFSAIGILTNPDAFKYPDNFDQGVAGKNKPAERNWYVERLNAEFERKSRIERDNALATAFIMALLQTEILDG